MEKCPACNAKHKGKLFCHRCNMDLRPLLEIEKIAAFHLEKARTAFADKNFETAFFHAKRSCSLRQTPAAAKILACSAVFVRKFDCAINHWAAGKNYRFPEK